MQWQWNIAPSLFDPPAKVGQTPLHVVEVPVGQYVHTMLLKEEGANEFGSIKDRIAWGLLVHAMTSGQLNADTHLVEPSSGNMGAALAGFAKRIGIQCTIVSDTKIASVNAQAIRGFGAELVLVDEIGADRDPDARIRCARDRAASVENGLFLNQYENPKNPETHAAWTAPEAFAQCERHGEVDAVFVAASSGGTYRGFRDYLASKGKASRLVVVDAGASEAIMPPELGAPPPMIPGFGSGRRISFVADHRDATIVRVSDEQALATLHCLKDRPNFSCGASSGGIIAGVISWLKTQGGARSVLVVCPDGSRKYALDLADPDYLDKKVPDWRRCIPEANEIISGFVSVGVS
jgi:N-(2-amino-2-carboxyethyl)-L-glutamate synthase